MKIDPSIFKAYDIRGINKETIDEEIMYKIARAYATLIQKELKRGNINIIIGRDMRLSSLSLTKAAIKGLCDQGANVYDIGLVSTPTMYFAVAHYKKNGGMIITASHNPKQWGGVKMTRARAVPIGENMGMEEIRDLTIKGRFKDPKKKGKITKKGGVLSEQIKQELTYADISKIKPLKVVVDPANAMGILYITELSKHLPINLIKMNFTLDGTFPAHEADPLKEENLVDLQKRVVKENADLGISIDGDGDRIFFVDNKGKIFPQPILRGLIAQSFLKDHPKATICYDIRPGKITEDMIKKAGGKPVITRVGHSLIKQKAIKVGAIFAGESSGHYFVKMPNGVYETPMIVILRLMQIISEEGKSLSEIAKPYDIYFHSGEINSIVDNVEKKLEELTDKYKKPAKYFTDMDGVTFEFNDYWFNVRPSNTEPKLRLNLEARTKKTMEEKRDKILKLIRS